MPDRLSLAALGGLLLRIGATSFGAHMALLGAVQKEVVERRHWMSGQEWGEIIALVSALPGPMAVNAVACLGYQLRGTAGSLVAGLAVLAPSMLTMTAYAVLHAAESANPLLRAALALLPAAVAAIVLAAAASLRSLALVGRGGRGITWIILGAAMVGLLLSRRQGTSETRGHERVLRPVLTATAITVGTLAAGWLPVRDSMGQLFLGFAHVSLFMFGGGYAAVPLFQQMAVEQHGWITAQTLSDAIALSQLTPGPIMTSSGFIGQQVAGLWGNAAALAGMFLPMAAISVLALKSMRGLAAAWWMQGILLGVRPAAMGVIAASGLLLVTRLHELPLTLPVFAICMGLLMRWRLPTYWLVPGVVLTGLVKYALLSRL
jgi:chromate transporter